jgi:multidrug efflux pump subunit AcrB
LPRDIDPPVVERSRPTRRQVVNVVVASGRDLRETTKIVDDRIKKNIESLQRRGAGASWDRTRQIHVWLDADKLTGYGLNVDQVRNARWPPRTSRCPAGAWTRGRASSRSAPSAASRLPPISPGS